MLYVFHRIKQLKAKAASIESFSNANDAMEYMNLVGKAQITYKLLAFTGDPKHGPGVYITDVDLANFSDGEAGVYRVKKEGKNWELSKKRQRLITSGLAAINGLCRDMGQAAVEIMPPMLESAYGDSKAELNAKGYDLFYNPPSLYDNGKKWKTPAQKQVTSEVTAMRLANAMKEASTRKHSVQWVVHGDGTKALHQALLRLYKIKDIDLSGHTLMFMAPQDVVADILPLARQCKIVLHNDVMKIHDDDIDSKRLQWGPLNRRKLGNELNQYGMPDQAYKLTNKLRRDQASMVKSLHSLGRLTFNLTTLIVAPAKATLSYGRVSSTLLSALTAFDSAQTFRNRLAAHKKITNPAYNPHLNPHKSFDDLNLEAKKASGNDVVKTFVDVVKAKRKGG